MAEKKAAKKAKTAAERIASKPSTHPVKPLSGEAAKHLALVRQICLALPDTFEKISHGEPTFFAGTRVFASFANNHHNDGRVAVWIPAAPGEQERLIRGAPATYFRPPYVGVSGWVGIQLDQIADEELGAHLHEAWQMILAKQRKPNQGAR